MTFKHISLALPPHLNAYLEQRAKDLDVTTGQVIRDLLDRSMKVAEGAKTSERADEQLVARLQRLLVPAMAGADDWVDLQNRLQRLGHELRPAGGGLTVHDAASGERLCKSSELGFAYSRLVRKFKAPMPGHPHKMAHILAVGRHVEDDMPDAFEVIERFSPFSEPARPVSRQSELR